MARKIIDIGIVGNDGTGDSIRDSFRKVNDNFRELYSSLGLGERLKFIGLDDVVNDEYINQDNAVLSVSELANDGTGGIVFKQLVGGEGISFDFDNPNEIVISSKFSALSVDTEPRLGGNLSVRSGGEQYRIVDMGTDANPLLPVFEHEAINKAYADSKIARAGVDAIDPRTQQKNANFGKMSGPLILSRNPLPEDDEIYNGLIAATKNYVDNSGFGSKINLYVATSGSDDRSGVSAELQGRALAFAYRTLEAALKRAEEIVLESPLEIGPYKKVLTFNNGAGQCTVAGITDAPASGSGFAGKAIVSVESIEINNPGVNYLPGDIITLSGGTIAPNGSPASIEILSVGEIPGTARGPILTWRLISAGLYTDIPGSNAVETVPVAPGTGITLNVTYRVNRVVLDPTAPGATNGGKGSGYGLVSVRIVGGGGTGAFGTADVVAGAIESITVTDQGRGFTSIPQVFASLPRLLLRTDGFRTDFTGDTTTNTPESFRSRDIREGLFLRGETSGTLAQILSHTGALDSDGNEIFDIDIKFGQFIADEVVAYGDVARTAQISVLLESGIYEENYPLRVPANTSIVGDEFRRCIIRPKPGRSTSPWSFIYFRRDETIGTDTRFEPTYNSETGQWSFQTVESDILQIASPSFGYHYLSNSQLPVYTLINNRGGYRSAAELLRINRQFLQKEVIAWINYQVTNGIEPFEQSFNFDRTLCERDVGLLLDSMIFDLKYGGNNRTVSAALKYFENASDLGDPAVVLSAQLSETLAAINHLGGLAQFVIRNVTINERYQTAINQTVDASYVGELEATGTTVNIQTATDTNPVAVITATPHSLNNGQEILISGVVGMDELNGRNFYAKVINSTTIQLYNDSDLEEGVNGINYTFYVSGGTVSDLGGVIGTLFNNVTDILENSNVVNFPRFNDELDVFLANDAVRWQAITAQGHGGFMLVLDPEGQILAKSPYAQECASFSKSTGRQTFAGGMFVDGFAGNLRFEILSKDSDTFLRVGGLKRRPQVPASFIVNDTVYRINYLRDFVYDPAGSTCSFVLDETTPWPFSIFSYDESICSRDVGLILDGLSYELVLPTNYHARKAGLSYRQANAAVVIEDQLDLTLRAIKYTHTLAGNLLFEDYPTAEPEVRNSERIIEDIIRNGASFAPALILDNPVGLPTALSNAKSLLLQNIPFIQAEVIGFINANAPVYDREQYTLDFSFLVDSVLNDAVFSSNYQSATAGLYYRRNEPHSLYVVNRLKSETISGINELRDLVISLVPSGLATIVNINFNIITTILNLGVGSVPSLTYTVPGSINANVLNSFNLISNNKSFVIDEVIAWMNNEIALAVPGSIWDGFTYNSTNFGADVGYLIDALKYDLLYGGNTSSVVAGKAYFYTATTLDQVDQTVAAYEHLKSVVSDIAQNITVTPSPLNTTVQVTGTPGSSSESTKLENLVDDIISIVEGNEIIPDNPTYSLGNSTNAAARLIVQANKSNIIRDALDFMEDNDLVFVYDQNKCRRDIQYIVEGLAYDLIYGGNSQCVDSGIKYYDGIGSDETLQIPTDQLAVTIAAIGHLKYVAQEVIINAAPVPTYSAVAQITGAASDAPTQLLIDNKISIIEDILSLGPTNAPTIVYPDLSAYAYNSSDKQSRLDLLAGKTEIQQAVIDFVDENANIFEVLMPGNRSMLGNDYTQINDMGYGIVAINGGLIEAVSIFTYYCYISYYSVTGGQIRSVGGSTAHGVYALVAEGADPLEVPTPVTLYHDFSQGVTCYFPAGLFANVLGGQEIYVTDYTYPPLDASELEIDHGLGFLFRYPVISASTAGMPPGVSKLTLRSAEGFGIDGLARAVPNGTRMTIRINAQIVLTGDVVDVATRPSTGLVLREAPTVYRILQFAEYQDPVGPKVCTITTGPSATIRKTNHGLRPNHLVSFTSTGNLPDGIIENEPYYVLADDFTEDTFKISSTKNGLPVNTSGLQSGTQSYVEVGLARTNLRENYDYIDMTVWPTQPYAASGVNTCTISIGDPAVITQASHGYNVNDVVRFEKSPGATLPIGITDSIHYFVKEVLGEDTFTITNEAISAAEALSTAGSYTGTIGVGKVIGRVGDQTIAIVPLGPQDQERVLGSKLVFLGEEYTVINYAPETVTLEAYALITFDRPLVDSLIYWTAPPTIKSAVAKDEPGTLTIRISLTRVTSHDLLEIGTGSYADTNYPNEIYGPAANPLQPGNETQERSVGRTFYVTTDQFGNFSVGPYFRVDQGTGTVTFSASIALTNLDGIGFKRGVPIAEFSTDSSFSDNATDTVPTENATRSYIDRRLGVSHNGAIVPDVNLIPSITGGYMSLDGQLAMKANMNLGGNKITSLGPPTSPTDAVSLESLTFGNFQDISVNGAALNDIIVFTGVTNQAVNAEIVGDISLTLDILNNQANLQIVNGSIVNADVNASAAIAQSKLNMNRAGTRANATGITQADLGLASFDAAQFDATNGFIALKSNGTAIGSLAKIAGRSVLGNNSTITDNVTEILFTTVTKQGGAILASQYSSSTGYLRRTGLSFTNTDNPGGDYTVIDDAVANTVNTLVKRDPSTGGFEAGPVNLTRLLIDGKITIDTNGVTSGFTQYHGFLSQVGILIGDGPVSGDKSSYYDNNAHFFRPQNGIGYAPVTVGTLTASTISSGATATLGTIIGDWRLDSGSRLQATYADLAEYYEGDEEYNVGTVLIFGGDKEVTISSRERDHRVAGVVSDTAAYSMNSSCSGLRNLIALQGRVPCRVVGKIEKGDLMVTSNIPGVAISAKGDAKAGTIIGKALENYDSDHIGTIEVAVGRA